MKGTQELILNQDPPPPSPPAPMNCLAKILATSQRSELPVAIPLTPPSGFVNAVNLAPIRTSAISTGTFPHHVCNGFSWLKLPLDERRVSKKKTKKMKGEKKNVHKEEGKTNEKI